MKTILKKSIKHGLAMVLLFLATAVFSQKKVADAKYNTLLSKLLSHTVPEVTPIEIVTTDTVLFLDAREKKEYKVSHIKEAVWVGYDSFMLSSLKEISKDKKIVVYCSVGYRSEKIAEKLLKSGYKDVSNLYGGIFEWVHENKKVYNTKGETKAVHTFDKEWSQWLFTGEKIY